MKALKILLIAVVALIVLLCAGGLLLSPKFTVSRTTTIEAAPDKVYALIADPRGWKQWSAWNRRDPAMAIEYSGAARRAPRELQAPATGGARANRLLPPRHAAARCSAIRPCRRRGGFARGSC